MHAMYPQLHLSFYHKFEERHFLDISALPNLMFPFNYRNHNDQGMHEVPSYMLMISLRASNHSHLGHVLDTVTCHKHISYCIMWTTAVHVSMHQYIPVHATWSNTVIKDCNFVPALHQIGMYHLILVCTNVRHSDIYQHIVQQKYPTYGTSACTDQRSTDTDTTQTQWHTIF